MNEDALPVSHNLKKPAYNIGCMQVQRDTTTIRFTNNLCISQRKIASCAWLGFPHHLYLNERVYTGGWGAKR